MTYDTVLGIEFGERYWRMAVIEDGTPTVLSNAEGNSATPAAVHYSENGSVRVGDPATEREPAEPERVVNDIAYRLGADSGSVEIGGQEYRPTEVASDVFEKLREDAERSTGTELSDLVVTVPSAVADGRSAAFERAATRAGFDTVRFVPSPVATIADHGRDRELEQGVVVVETRPETVTVTVVDVCSQGYELVANNVLTDTGTADVDRALMRWIAARHDVQTETSILDASGEIRDDEIRENLRYELDNIVAETSHRDDVEIEIPFLGQIDDEIVNVSQQLAHETLEALAIRVYEYAVGLAEVSLEATDIDAADLEDVLLVGDSIRLPGMSDQFERHIGRRPIETDDGVLAKGAACCGVGDTNG